MFIRRPITGVLVAESADRQGGRTSSRLVGSVRPAGLLAQPVGTCQTLLPAERYDQLFREHRLEASSK
jgi:hypothetical protein